MRCPRCYAETPAEVLCCPGCKLPTPKGRNKSKPKGERTAPRTKRAKKKDSKSVNPIVAVAACVVAVLVFGLGGYFAMALMLAPKPVDPASPQYAIEKLRAMPSNQKGLTIEERLEQEVKKSRDAGRLVEIEAWSVKPIEASNYLVSYSIQEKDEHYLRAEWSVDVASGAIVPQTALATEIYNR